MRKIVFTGILGLFALVANAQEFKFEKETIDYGKITLGSEGKRVFEFTNVGDAPLEIKRIQSTCGCTVPKKPEKPIMPGEKGQIEVSYDTNRAGGFNKAITVYSNAKQERKMLKIKGYVTKEDAPAKKKSIVEK